MFKFTVKNIFTFFAMFTFFGCSIYLSDGSAISIGTYRPLLAPGYDTKDSFIENIQIELNKVRRDPQEYARDVLVPSLDRYKNYIYTDYSGKQIRSEEGASAMLSCIKALKKELSKSMFLMEKGLHKASQHFADDQARTGRSGEFTSRGEDYEDLIEMYGRAKGYIGAIRIYGKTNPRDIVISLLVGDGDVNRRNRGMLLSTKYGQIGVGYAYGGSTHKDAVVVIYFAEKYSSYY